MNYGLVKTIIGTVAAVGAGQVVGNVVRVTTPDGLGRFARITTKIGGVVLGGLVGKHAEDYAHATMDELVNLWMDMPSRKDTIKGEVVNDSND